MFSSANLRTISARISGKAIDILQWALKLDLLFLRLMEFNQLINRYLVRDPDARKRNLHIRTYGVIPLNEDCGLIEWIPNLMGLRPLLNRIYRDKNMLMSGAELKKKMPMLRDPLHRKRDLFEKGKPKLF